MTDDTTAPQPVPPLPPPNLAGQALRLVTQKGFWVFPCHPGLKTPATRHGLHDSSNDPDQITRWWDSNPAYNIGIDCGRSGLVVVDCDVKGAVDGLENWVTWLHTLTDEPDLDVLAARTPSKGWHFYQLWDHAEHKLGNSASKIAPGVDVRGQGGYVVAAPSVVTSGAYAGSYRWERGPLVVGPDWLRNGLIAAHDTHTYTATAQSFPTETTFTQTYSFSAPASTEPLPDFAAADLADQIAAVPAPPALPKVTADNPPQSENYGPNALAHEVNKVRSAPEGTRNDTLNKAAFRMGQLSGQGYLDPLLAQRQLAAAALAAGLERTEIDKTFHSGFSRGLEAPRP